MPLLLSLFSSLPFVFFLPLPLITLWLSHSPTIKEYESVFLVSFKDIELMYYVIYHDPTLLHQTNGDNNKVY